MTSKTLPVSLTLSDEEKAYKGIPAVDEREARYLEAVDQIEGEKPLGNLLELISDETIAGILQGHLTSLVNESLTKRLNSIGDERNRAADRYQEALRRNELAEQIAQNASGIDPNVLPPKTSVIILAEPGRPQTSGPTVVVELVQLHKGPARELRSDLFIARLELVDMPSYYRLPQTDPERNEVAALFGVQMAHGGYWSVNGHSFRSGLPCMVRDRSFSYAEVERAARATSQRDRAFPGAKMQASLTYRELIERGVNPEDARQAALESVQEG